MAFLDEIVSLIRLALIIFVAGVIVLTVLRVGANWLGLNPFGWLLFHIRKLTEPFLSPLRRSQFGLYSRYDLAPILLVVLMILLGAVGLRFLDEIQEVIVGVQRGFRIMYDDSALIGLRYIVGNFLLGIVSVLLVCIILQVVFSWFGVFRGRLPRFVWRVTEPILLPLRRLVPSVGMFDITPIVAYFLLILVSWAIRATFFF